MKAAERILRNDIVQKMKTIKLPTCNNARINSPEVFSAVPEPELGTLSFIGSDIEVKVYVRQCTIEYVGLKGNEEPEVILRHNVHNNVEANIECINSSLRTIIKVLRESNLLD